MTEYYTNQDATIRFDVYKDGELCSPRDAIVSAYAPGSKFIEQSVAQVKGSEVIFVLPGEKVETRGIYVFVFKISIARMADYTHVVNIDVKDLPVEEPEVSNVNAYT